MDTTHSAKAVHPYERITAEIVAAMEKGQKDFQMPWHQSAAHVPKNATTRKRYRGINILALWATAMVRGYDSSYWATYRQWATLGGQVKRGEKATTIVFYKEVERSDPIPSEDTEGIGTRWVARASWVFNEAQVEGLISKEAVDSEVNPVDVLADADAFVSSVGATIIEGGDRALYKPSTDTIHMPDRYRFHGTDTSSATEAYYAVLLHELVHWSGHDSRLKRNLSGTFGAMAYAMEELVAEFGAAFLCADLGVSAQPREDHAVYLSSWIRVLKERSRAIVSATSAATAACQFLESLRDE